MAEERTVYITNLDDKVTKDILEEIFTQVGPVESVAIINGSIRYSFVQFTDEESVPFCISTMDGLKLYGTAICVRPRANTEQDRIFKAKYGNQRRHSYGGGPGRGSSSTDDTPEYHPMKSRRSYHDEYNVPARYKYNQAPISRPLVSLLSLQTRDPFATPTYRNPLKRSILEEYDFQAPRRPGNQRDRDISAGRSYNNLSVAHNHRNLPATNRFNTPGFSSRYSSRQNNSGNSFGDPHRTF